ncbi:MAG: hypothetical protein Q9200_006978 [Gallowayella weberi]
MGSQETLADFVSPFADEHYTDFYDAHVAKFWKPGHGSDIQLIWESLQDLLGLKDHASPLNVVDIGTGTGRIIQGLLANAEAEGMEKLDAKFFGVDPGPMMLRRGRELLEANERLHGIADVEWVPSDALGFTADSPTVRGATDLLFFAGGGFNHLLSPGEIVGFLREVGRALRTNSPSATAVIVIQGEAIPSMMAAFPNSDGEASVVLSEKRPEITYEKSADTKTWAGPLHVDAFTLKVKSTSDGSVLKEFKFRFDLRQFDEEAWPGMVEQAGLKITRTRDYALGRAYYLQKAR